MFFAKSLPASLNHSLLTKMKRSSLSCLWNTIHLQPKKHLTDLFTLDDETAAKIIKKSIKIAKAMRSSLSCDGVYVTQTNGACAGQDVFHYHMHLYPKWNDGKNRHREQDKTSLANEIKAGPQIPAMVKLASVI